MKAVPVVALCAVLSLTPVACGGDGGGGGTQQDEELQEVQTPTEEAETPDEGYQE